MRIRDAVPADAAALLDLQRLAYHAEGERYRDPKMAPLVQTLDEIEAQFRDHVILKIVDDDGRLVASVRAVEKDGTCFIGRLMTRPDCQRKGYGRALMKAIEARFPDAERFELFTGHLSGHQLRLYRDLGYRETRRERVNEGTVLVYMEKRR